MGWAGQTLHFVWTWTPWWSRTRPRLSIWPLTSIAKWPLRNLKGTRIALGPDRVSLLLLKYSAGVVVKVPHSHFPAVGALQLPPNLAAVYCQQNFGAVLYWTADTPPGGPPPHPPTKRQVHERMLNLRLAPPPCQDIARCPEFWPPLTNDWPGYCWAIQLCGTGGSSASLSSSMWWDCC